jgi:hypothetical protein
LNWWRLGYCNAFGYDLERGEKGSVGLGGNISMSMGEFEVFIYFPLGEFSWPILVLAGKERYLVS